MELFEAIKNRRSIRKYKADAVSDDQVNKILEAGRWAPSWANTQCSRFVVIRDVKVKADLAKSLQGIKLPDGREFANPGTAALNTVPVVIAVCAETGKSGAKKGADGKSEYTTDKGDWFMFDTALAVQNMVLAAHAQGLGTVIIGAFDAAIAEKAINIPQGYRIVTFLPLGVPDQELKAPPRKELTETAVKDKF
jgi:nitroreductase